jgi:hypothetical protein
VSNAVPIVAPDLVTVYRYGDAEPTTVTAARLNVSSQDTDTVGAPIGVNANVCVTLFCHADVTGTVNLSDTVFTYARNTSPFAPIAVSGTIDVPAPATTVEYRDVDVSALNAVPENTADENTFTTADDCAPESASEYVHEIVGRSVVNGVATTVPTDGVDTRSYSTRSCTNLRFVDGVEQ